METQNYRRKIEELSDPVTYKRLNREPTSTVPRRTDALIKQCSMAPNAKAALQVSEALPPRLYGLLLPETNVGYRSAKILSLIHI